MWPQPHFLMGSPCINRHVSHARQMYGTCGSSGQGMHTCTCSLLGVILNVTPTPFFWWEYHVTYMCHMQGKCAAHVGQVDRACRVRSLWFGILRVWFFWEIRLKILKKGMPVHSWTYNSDIRKSIESTNMKLHHIKDLALYLVNLSLLLYST